MEDSLQVFFVRYQHQINQYLEQSLPFPEGAAKNLHQAIRYTALSGGKRLRPMLCYAAAQAIAEPCAATDRVAASVELIHAYSLVHDDLPAMDNDALRRGQPTCHIAFDEATAILAGDALQTQAFKALADITDKKPETIVQLIQNLANASGSSGMVAGQAIDIASVDKPLSLEQLQHMHQLKTGALIKASVTMGAIATEQHNQNQLTALAKFGDLLGLAFQVHDDVLDVLSNTETLGKSQGADSHLNKPTYTSLLGVEKAQQTAIDLVNQALNALSEFNEKAVHLREIARFVISRAH